MPQTKSFLLIKKNENRKKGNEKNEFFKERLTSDQPKCHVQFRKHELFKGFQRPLDKIYLSGNRFLLKSRFL